MLRSKTVLPALISLLLLERLDQLQQFIFNFIMDLIQSFIFFLIDLMGLFEAFVTGVKLAT